MEFKTISLKYILRTLPTEGFLVYEYNPFRNYRASEDLYYYNGSYHTESQAKADIPEEDMPKYKYKKGSLLDFDTDELQFNINYPVNMLPQYSYDGSVNLIINDGLNIPKIINSRFSPIGRNRYQIVDRTGENDTNIYDYGSQFYLDTSLYKRVLEIPKLEFLGAFLGGNLAVGNYFFYFKYLDADGNDTDFVAESSLVSLFIGTTPGGIKTGFVDESSNKLVKFKLSNIDTAYPYVQIYYVRSTAEINQNQVKQAYKITRNFLVNNNQESYITITGYEDKELIDVTELNVTYNIVDSVITHEHCQNMLFFGGVNKPKVDYKELQDIALRFCATPALKQYKENCTDLYKNTEVSNSYYDPVFIYNYTGYWPRELYRLGVVFILDDGTYTNVFNIRGQLNIEGSSKYQKSPMWETVNGVKERRYIEIDEQTNLLKNGLDNSKGVVSFKIENPSTKYMDILGIKIQYLPYDESETSSVFQKHLKGLGIKGYFFVRQTRIPHVLCQGLSIVTDRESNTLRLPVSSADLALKTNIWKSVSDAVHPNKTFDKPSKVYISEAFLPRVYYTMHYNIFTGPSGSLTCSSSRLLGRSPLERYNIDKWTNVSRNALICPEYDVNQEYLNNFFTGDELIYELSETQPSQNVLTIDSNNTRHFINTYGDFTANSNFAMESHRTIGVPDGVNAISVGNTVFSTKAGNAEEAWRFSFIGWENKDTKAANLLRGLWGPFVGIADTFQETNRIYNIKTQASATSWQNQLDIRAQDSSQYYCISDKFSINDGLNHTVYRGDCYICQFTHRVNRNFNDPSAPYNHKIVNTKTWVDNFQYNDGIINSEKAAKINLGDVNAVELGMWITFPLRSSFNLNIRSTDESFVDEMAEAGHARGFYPLQDMSTAGTYKLPEAQCINKGFQVSVGEKWYSKLPDVPYIKNEFTNRIMYSDINVTDAFKNGFRVFRSTNYRDYPKTYGAITKLVEMGGNLLCVFEHGVAVIPVNERAVAASGSGGNVFINTSNVLPENLKVISDMFGSQWQDSVLKTPQFVYGVDTVAKKIWRTDGNNFECISDFKVQEFLNNNISLGEREITPILGIRNVKTMYNAFKQDILFTFYDNTYGFEEKVWNLCFNEKMNLFVTFYSWVPSFMENIDNIPFSFNRDTSKWLAKLGTSHTESSFADGITLSNVVLPNSKSEITTEGLPEYTLTFENTEGVEETETYTGLTVGKYDDAGNIISDSEYLGVFVGYLNLSNRVLPSSDVDYRISYTLERDMYGNYKKFEIKPILDSTGNPLKYPDNHKFEDGEFYIYGLFLKVSDSDYAPVILRDGSYVYPATSIGTSPVTTYTDTNKPESLLAELYYRNVAGHSYADVDTHKIAVGELYTIKDDQGNETTSLASLDSSTYRSYPIYKSKAGKRLNLPKEKQINSGKLVTLLNIKANIQILEQTNSISVQEDYYNYLAGYEAGTTLVNAGYYESTVAVTPEWNLQFLSTDFWKHGQAGLIDIADDIYPTYWYGKQHPFEFEFIVVNDPITHKIFHNLEITANKAQPESFHYEIIGECYDFAKDKVNMYFRQEAKKALWQYNGADIVYDRSFLKVQPKQQARSADLVHRYYTRQDTINEVEDYYIHATYPEGYDYRHLSGGEIVYYPNRQEYRIWNHVKATNLNDLSQDDARSIITANCQYLEDKWNVVINPILVCYKNEYKRMLSDTLITPINSTWANSNLPPLTVANSPIPDQVYEYLLNTEGKLEIPDDLTNLGYGDLSEAGRCLTSDEGNKYYIDMSNWLDDVNIYKTSFGAAQNRKEIDLKDRFMKVRIRYSGEELAIIDLVNTLYQVSLS